jgi:hypothetical protein
MSRAASTVLGPSRKFETAWLVPSVPSTPASADRTAPTSGT